MNDFIDRANEIIAAGRELYQMGLVPATSGNFSARLNDGNIAITVSGAHKGRLTETDIMILDAKGIPLDDRRPSAETGLHLQIYNHFPTSRAILHPHAMNAVLLARKRSGHIKLSNYELLKAFPGFNTHAATLTVPVFENDQDIERLSAKVETYMLESETTVAYIIAGHGFYTWGEDMKSAMRHVEALDYLLACELNS